MDGLTRKPFGALTKRQQYIRLERGRMLEKSLKSNVKCQQCKSIHSENENINNENIATHVEVPAQVMEVQLNDSVECLEGQINDGEVCRIERHSNEVINVNVDNGNTIEGVEMHSKENFQNLLQQCCLNMNINHIQTKAILRVLRTHPCFNKLPKDSRTLLKTGCNRLSFIPIGDGYYWHVGFLRILEQHLYFYSNLPSVLEIEVNTDGLSLSRSNPTTFWPIQYRVINIEGFKPLIAGIYKGAEKPSDPFAFFESFIEEAMEAKSSGGILIRNQKIPLIFKRFVADAPARSLILNHFGHNSLNPCSKCTVTGVRYENRIMSYAGTNHAKRTDDEYVNDIDENHQRGESPLSKLAIPLVSGVVFDVMHLVYLGATVRFLNAWSKGKFGYDAKLPSWSLNELFSRYEQLDKACPTDFARRPRNLSKYGNFKATELRHFTLYAAPVILLGILPPTHYFHFLLFNIAMRILTCRNPQEEQLNTAEAALKVVVEHAPALYTPAFLSYNVHCLQHLVEDARECGSLDNCAAFVYENNMPLFRKNIRNHPRPLQQFANRLHEKSSIQHLPKEKLVERVSVQHKQGPEPENLQLLNYTQYKKYDSPKFNFSLDERNSFCKMEDESICKVVNIVNIADNIFVLVKKFKYVENFFESPVKSSTVGIYKCKHLCKKLHLMAVNNISSKCYCMPSWKASFHSTKVSEKKADEFIIMTLLHTEKQ